MRTKIWKPYVVISAIALGTVCSSTALAVTPATFAPRVDFATQLGPFTAAIADLNHDGRPDMVVTNTGSNSVSVRLGDGAGGFGPSAEYGTGDNPETVAVGDLNGDGNPDLAVSNLGANTVSVLLGDGRGGFGTRTDFPAGAGTRSVAIGDLNGDGHADLVTGNWYSASVSVLLGNGDGAFDPPRDFPAGGVQYWVAIGDLNGDGHPDLVTANLYSNTVSVLLGRGDGTFGSATDFATGEMPAMVAIGDLDGDGAPDLAVANSISNTMTVLRGDGRGGFAGRTDYPAGNHPTPVAIADLNQDGIPDLVTTNYYDGNVSVFLGIGAGNFAPRSDFAAGGFPGFLGVADLNGDGKIDLVVPNTTDNTVSVFLNTTSLANHPPIADAGPDVTAECASHTTTPVGLSGLASSDPDGDALTYAWAAPGVTFDNPGSPTPTGQFAAGATTVTLTVTDTHGASAADQVVVRVADTQPPSISVAVTPTELWPPNGKLIDVHATVTAGDLCDASPSFVLTSITSSCRGVPDDSSDPNRPLIAGATYGTADLDFQLRAEKSTMNGDRLYTIVYTATDHSGNSASASATVKVPHDKRAVVVVAAGGSNGSTAPAGDLAIVVPTVVQAPQGDPDDASQQEPRTPLFVFDAMAVNPATVWMGNSAGLVAPTAVTETDRDGDGYNDLVLDFGPAAVESLAAIPVSADDPMTFYYQTWTGAGYFAAVSLPADVVAAAARWAGARRPAGPAPATALVVPRLTRLGPGTPNPARAAMSFALDLSSERDVRLVVYDLRGARVRTLLKGFQPAGTARITWDGRDESGRPVANGVYLVRADAGDYHATRKAILMR